MQKSPWPHGIPAPTLKAQKFPEKAKQREIECIMIYSLSCLAPLGNERAALELETEAHVVAAVEFAGIIVAQMYLNAVSSARPPKVHDYRFGVVD